MFLSLNNLFLALGTAMTPHERFRAMQRIDANGLGIDFLTGRWLELAGWLF
jgi:hypothetical protein